MVSPHRPETWPLVGRQQEVSLIDDLLQRSDTAGVVIAGPAGVGKTRILHEALVRGRGRGQHTATAFATAASRPIPFGALAHLLPEELPSVRGFRNLIGAAERAVLAHSPGKTLLVGIDDAQHLDEHSAALVHHLANRRAVSLVVSIRTGDTAPDPVVALWKDGLCERIELRSLSPSETQELLAVALGGQVDSTTVHRLWTRSQGNPLYLRELVVGGVESGALVETAGVWQWAGPLAMSGWLEGLIAQRLEGVNADERALLELIACAEPVERELVAASPCGHALEDLERRGLAEEIVDGVRGRVRLAHPLYGESVRAKTPPARARSIQGHLADALQARGARRREDVLRLAAWRMQSGALEEPGQLTVAARRAMSILDGRMAERLSRAARAAGGGLEPGLILGEALIQQGRFEDAEDELRRLHDEMADDESKMRVASPRAQNLGVTLHRGDDVVQMFEEMERSSGSESVRLEAAANRAVALFFGERMDDASVIADSILAREDSPPRAISLALQVACNAAWLRGRPMSTLDLLERRKRDIEAGAPGFPGGAFAIATRRMYAVAALGDVAEMVRINEALSGEALERGAEWLQGYAAFGLGWAARLQGRAKTAAAWLRESHALLQDNDFRDQTTQTLAELAHALSLVGDVVGARSLLGQLEGRRSPNWTTTNWSLPLARAWTAAADGNVSAAISTLMAADEHAAAVGAVTHRLWFLHDAARLGAARSVSSTLRDLAAIADGPLAAAFAAHACALTDGDAVGLDEASGSFESLGLWLFAAECAAEAASHHDTAGHRGSAGAARARAAALAARCEGARTPALTGLDRELPLTSREREVATLAARGLSNPEIAERLVVSVRTVENHLHSTYAKLGVSGREELAPILVPLSDT